MNGRIPAKVRVATIGATATAFGLLGILPAAAAEGGDEVQVVNTETVQVYVDADGDIQSKRIYEQIGLVGKGKVDLRNPVSTKGLRNLDGFGGFDVKDGEQVTEVTVDGEERLRSVSDYSGDLPLDVKVSYSLDGRTVKPGDVVGKDGELEVRFTVKNVTAVSQEVSFDDGHGGQVTKTVDVPIPMVGSLSTVAPPNFTEVHSDQANMAGDGKGGTKLSFTMTLFPPIGSDTAEFGYTARITDGVVPRVSISALPVNPLESPSFKTAGESYKGGAETGIQLTDGASQIDANLLKLRDGAGELLAGLIQLNNGAAELHAGAGTAAEGGTKLAAGAGQLADGTGQARTGSEKLSDGLGQISGGLSKLADSEGLPAAKKGAADLKAGVDLLISKLGSPEDPQTLIGGLSALETGLGAATTGAGQIAGGLKQMAAPDKLPAAQAGAAQIRDGLEDSVKAGGSLDQLKFALSRIKADACDPAPDDMVTGVAPVAVPCSMVVDDLISKVEGSKVKLRDEVQAGAGAIANGLADAIAALNGLLIPGANELATKLGVAETGAGKLKNGAIEFKGGMRQVSGGMTKLADGITTAVAGVLQLSDGASEAHAGSGDLSDGLAKLDDGAGQLSAGAGELATGLGKLEDGSGRLSEGLGKAASGAPALEDGAQRLSDEGTSKLVEAGEATAQNYGEMYAVIEAGAQRAQSEKMIVGAPENASGLAAYSYELMAEDGEGGRNLSRGLGGLVLLGAGAGVFALRRKFI